MRTVAVGAKREIYQKKILEVSYNITAYKRDGEGRERADVKV